MPSHQANLDHSLAVGNQKPKPKMGHTARMARAAKEANPEIVMRRHKIEAHQNRMRERAELT